MAKNIRDSYLLSWPLQFGQCLSSVLSPEEVVSVDCEMKLASSSVLGAGIIVRPHLDFQLLTLNASEATKGCDYSVWGVMMTRISPTLSHGLRGISRGKLKALT